MPNIMENNRTKFFSSSSADATESTNNNVDHPSHYQGPHECIDVMRALFGDEAVLNFCRCNSFKYRFRADAKNKEEDIKKAEFYENYIIKMLGIKPIDYKENNNEE